MPDSRGPLVLVSNRGPVTFQDDGDVKRGTGGLVTALTGLASHRDAVWIASALTDGDARKAHEAEGSSFAVRSPAGGEYQVRLVVSDPDAYDRFYNIFANPMLWFIQHYLWDLSNAPDIRRSEVEAFEFGYNTVLTRATSSSRSSVPRYSIRARRVIRPGRRRTSSSSTASNERALFT